MTTTKVLDLGRFQDAVMAAQRTADLDAKVLRKAQEAADRSQAAFALEVEKLKAASRIVSFFLA